jgi:hypothetical protein
LGRTSDLHDKQLHRTMNDQHTIDGPCSGACTATRHMTGRKLNTHGNLMPEWCALQATTCQQRCRILSAWPIRGSPQPPPTTFSTVEWQQSVCTPSSLPSKPDAATHQDVHTLCCSFIIPCHPPGCRISCLISDCCCSRALGQPRHWSAAHPTPAVAAAATCPAAAAACM